MRIGGLGASAQVVDPRLGVAVVGVDIDRALKQKRFIQPIQLFLPGLFGDLEVRLDRRLSLLPQPT